MGSIQAADVLIALDALGADAAALRDEAGITRQMLEDPAGRVPASAAVRIFELAAEALNDPLAGLNVGLKLRPRGPLFFLLLAGPDTRHAIRAYARFAKLALDTIEVRFVERADHAELTFDPVVPALRASHHLLDYCVTSNLAAMRGSIPGFEPIGVDLAHAEVGPSGGTARALNCPVRFDRSVTAVHMPLEILDGRPFAANPLIAEQLAKMQQAVLANLGTSDARERVAATIRRMLAAGVTPQRSDVARQLHVSERTLQRQLESEGTTFKSVRDDVRTELSRALLSDRSMKVEAIARSLGYAEVASFSKAFARWSGGPPSTFRSAGAGRTAARRSAARQRDPG
ncbi:AraC family transcriptional regulator [Candidatus Binatia bacterium]|nr:AraC family transcriptional regulator [Candidatus Binatia bacterium]